MDNRQAKSKAMDQLSTVAVQLSILSDDLDRVGNYFLGERVFKIGRSVRDSLETLERVDGEEVAEMMQRAQEGSANMLRACLAGAQLQKENGAK